VPTAWVAAPPDAVLHRVAAALGDPQRSGVVLAGADGVGKTLLARSAAERFAADKPSTVVRWVAGTATERIVPFGAFGDLLQITDVAATGRPAELLRAAHDSLIGDGGELLLWSTTHTTWITCRPPWCTSWRSVARHAWS
jgi:hypothetical protein